MSPLFSPAPAWSAGYEPYTIATQDGRVYNGILGRDTVEAIYLITADRTEIRIPRSAIEEIGPSRVSIMPQGLDGQLSQRELGDLVAFLSSLK